MNHPVEALDPTETLPSVDIQYQPLLGDAQERFEKLQRYNRLVGPLTVDLGWDVGTGIPRALKSVSRGQKIRDEILLIRALERHGVDGEKARGIVSSVYPYGEPLVGLSDVGIDVIESDPRIPGTPGEYMNKE